MNIDSIQKAKQILLKILDIIQYENDKNSFANEFLDLTCRKAILDAIFSLPENTKADVIRKLQETKQIDESFLILVKNIPSDKFREALETESFTMFDSYLKTVIPTLNTTQQKKLFQYLKSITGFNEKYITSEVR